MAHYIFSWQREMLKLFIQYLAVGFSSLPAGLVYLFLLNSSLNQSIAIVITLCVGLTLAYLVWIFLDKRILLPRQFCEQPNNNTTEAGSDLTIQLPYLRLATGTPIVLAAVLVVTTPIPNQTIKISFSETETDTATVCKIAVSEV